MDTMDIMDTNGQNGHVQQVTSLNLSIRPSNGKSIVSIPSMSMKMNENALPPLMQTKYNSKSE